MGGEKERGGKGEGRQTVPTNKRESDTMEMADRVRDINIYLFAICN